MATHRMHARNQPQPVLRINELSVAFHRRSGVVRAVDHVNLDIWPREIVGVIGESGSGKTLTALSTIRLMPHGARLGGSVRLGDTELLTLGEPEMMDLRGRRIAYIPQDAMQSLNPTLRTGRQVGEPFELHRRMSVAKALQKATELLGAVHIPHPDRRARQFPHEFSGGMQQRAMIAMGLALHPELIIADEPTTALDVTVQAQILKLLREVRDDSGAAIMFITHELGIVAELCDWVYVMHRGRVVEDGPVAEIFANPRMDYTRMLLEATPSIHSRAEFGR